MKLLLSSSGSRNMKQVFYDFITKNVKQGSKIAYITTATRAEGNKKYMGPDDVF